MSGSNSQNLSYLLDEVVSAVTFAEFYEEPFMFPELYDIRTSNKRRERSASTTGLGVFERKLPGHDAATDEIENAYEKDFVHDAYAKQVPVERELIDDQEWGLLEDIGRQLGHQAYRTMEIMGANLFLDATTGASYRAEDGAAICGTHTTKSGATITNAGTDALSVASIKSTRTAMRKFVDHRGQLASIRPNALLVAPDIEDTAWEIVKSTGKPDSAENATNFWYTKFQLFVWDFLSEGAANGDDDQWFMMDLRHVSRNLIWYQRTALEVYGDGNLTSGTRRLGAYFRVSNGMKDYRGIFCHKPAA